MIQTGFDEKIISIFLAYSLILCQSNFSRILPGESEFRFDRFQKVVKSEYSVISAY